MSDYQNYQKQATENGLDSEEAKKASEQYAQNMSEAIQKALENGDDEVANYFESLYPDLQSVVETWKFKLKSHQNGMMARRMTSTTKRPIKR